MRLFLSAIFILGAQSVLAVPIIPVVGIDQNGKTVETTVSSGTYQNQLALSLNEVHQATMPVLDKQRPDGDWALNVLVVGVGLNLEAGISPIFKLSFTPRFRLLFSNSLDPAIP